MIKDKTKRLGKEVFSVYAKKRAIIGMDGLRGLILKGYNAITGNDLKPFPTLEEAKDYLVYKFYTSSVTFSRFPSYFST